MSRDTEDEKGKSRDDSDDDVLLDDWPEEQDGASFPEESEATYESELLGEEPFLRPMSGRKVWVILGLILIGIAVAVLYVYQAGDRKTVLGNQPIPAVGMMNIGQPLAVVPNAPTGGNLQQAPVEQNLAVGNSTMVSCHNCGTKGLPVCATCGSVMKPLPGNSALFVCTTCGSVGMPICPHCGGSMSTGGQQNIRTAAAVMPQGNASVGGQFQCPGCQATGLPNWNGSGTPLCPNCGAQMNVVQAQGGTTLAAAP